MCTGILYRNGKYSFFGRNLDLQYQLASNPTVCPRNYVLKYHHLGEMPHHSAIVGMAITGYGYPLFFEGINEYGVGAASLNFPNYGQYNTELEEGKKNVTSFELIPYLLCTCKNLEDVKKELADINLVADDFNEKVKSVPLHWIVADRTGSVIVERTATGLHVYDNELNVLTNAPDYPAQTVNLANYLNLTPGYPHNRMIPHLNVPVYSSGMGSDGLPGGLDSMSRFVRVAFMMNNSKAEESEEATLNQFFRIMQTVEQINGVNEEKGNLYEITNYTAGANLDTMDYYWTTYNNQQINAIHTKGLDLEQSELIVYPTQDQQNINWVA
ncbi:choloylglycine hydrolase family protein [Erysipelotrichaceae bacterium RD49]|nr:choloylglycine hydrolase family protein [Erysipelotrichaceae bacterium RD49]